MVFTPLRVVLVAAWAIAIAQAATVVIVDSATNSVLRHTQNTQLDATTLTAVDAAFLRLQPADQLDRSSTAKVEQLFDSVRIVDSKQQILEHPTAFLFVNLFGLEQDGAKSLVSPLDGAKYSVLEVDAKDHGFIFLKSLQDLESANPDVPFHHLDRFSAQDCGEQCVAESLKELLPIIEATATEGTLKLHSAELDLKVPVVRLFATELALFFRSAKAVLSSSAQDVLVMDVVFSDLQALADSDGPDAIPAAVDAIIRIVKWMESQYNEKKNGHFAFQVAMLGKVTELEFAKLMQPKPLSAPSRRLQAAASYDEETAAEKFGNHAAVYGAAFLLVYFTYAGIYCLTSMKFKQDTLLYSKGKVD